MVLKSYYPKVLKSNCPKVQRPKCPKVQRYKSPKVQKSKGPKVQRSKGPKVQKSKGPKVQWSKSPLVQKSKSLKVQKFKGPKVQRSKRSKSPNVPCFSGPILCQKSLFLAQKFKSLILFRVKYSRPYFNFGAKIQICPKIRFCQNWIFETVCKTYSSGQNFLLSFDSCPRVDFLDFPLLFDLLTLILGQNLVPPNPKKPLRIRIHFLTFFAIISVEL